MSDYYARTLVYLLGKPDETRPHPDQFRYLGVEGVESFFGAEHVVQLLFMLIREKHGDQIARRIFAKWGTPPSKSRLAMIKNIGLLDRFDLMRPKPNVQKLARQLAAENKNLPKDKRRGAGSTDAKALEKQIRRQIRERGEHMQKGTWLGPFPPGR